MSWCQTNKGSICLGPRHMRFMQLNLVLLYRFNAQLLRRSNMKTSRLYVGSLSSLTASGRQSDPPKCPPLLHHSPPSLTQPTPQLPRVTKRASSGRRQSMGSMQKKSFKELEKRRNLWQPKERQPTRQSSSTWACYTAEQIAA